MTLKRIISIITAVLLVLGSYSLCFASQGILTNKVYVAQNTGNTCSLRFDTSDASVGNYTVNINNYENFSNCDTIIDIGLRSKSYCSNITFSNISQYRDTDDTYYIRGWDDIIPSASPASLSFTYNGGYSGDWLFTITFSTQAVVPDDPISYYGIEVIGEGGTPIPVGDYTLPCGNTLYIDYGASGSSFDLSFDCTFRDTAGALNSTFADTFYYCFANSIPQTSSSFTPSVGTYITMYKNMDSANVLGYTKVGYGSISGTTTGQYLVIVNPLMYAQSTNVYNTSLKISGIPVGTSIYTYPVSSSISGDEVMSTITSPVGGTGTVSASGGAITTVSTEDSNVSYTPNSGGNTVDDTSHNYVNDVVSSIDDTLSDFTSGVSNLLSAPIGHINQLISSGSNFFQHLSGLWSWLPSEVVATISGALSLVVTVAIFKVFL